MESWDNALIASATLTLFLTLPSEPLTELDVEESSSLILPEPLSPPILNPVDMGRKVAGTRKAALPMPSSPGREPMSSFWISAHLFATCSSPNSAWWLTFLRLATDSVLLISVGSGTARTVCPFLSSR